MSGMENAVNTPYSHKYKNSLKINTTFDILINFFLGPHKAVMVLIVQYSYCCVSIVYLIFALCPYPFTCLLISISCLLSI